MQAISDLYAGLLRWEVWTYLAWNDVRQRYHRSVLGPYWVTASLAIFVSVLGPLYASLMRLELAVYVPHLILGLLVWNLFSNTMIEGCQAFSGAANYIKAVKLPYSIFIYRLVWRNTILFLYQFIVFLVAIVLLGLTPKLEWSLALVGLLLILANALWVGLACGLIAARYRDFKELLGSLLRIAFFLTPIIWMTGNSARFQLLADFNPFYHLIEVFRGPILGSAPRLESWLVGSGIAAAGWLVTLRVFVRTRSYLPFWLS